jgi:hypothetical protein
MVPTKRHRLFHKFGLPMSLLSAVTTSSELDRIMLRQLDDPHLFGQQFPGGFFFPFADSGPKPTASRKAPAAADFPRRPDASIINESIPLFYIGQNRKGRWVVREAEGRSGGLFLIKQWAVRFARRQSEPSGCAIMFLAEPIELDIDSHGRCATLVPSTKSPSAESSHSLSEAVVSGWRKLVNFISRNIDAQRRNRTAIERELFHGQYTLTSKNDDDLPPLP